MSMKKAGITIFILIIMIVIILLTVRGCSFSKKSEENVSKNNQSEVVLEAENSSPTKEENSSNTNVEKEETVEKAPSNSENTVVKEGNKSEKEKDTQPIENDKKGDSKVGVFVEKSSFTLGENKVIDALVSSKNSYLVDGKFYAYSLSIILPGDKNYNIVDYYCPKKTYDAVSAGDTIKVDYQLDKSGAVSINSITK